MLFSQLSKRMMDKKFRDKVTDTLQLLEQNGGKVAADVLKSLYFLNQQALLSFVDVHLVVKLVWGSILLCSLTFTYIMSNYTAPVSCVSGDPCFLYRTDIA